MKKYFVIMLSVVAMMILSGCGPVYSTSYTTVYPNNGPQSYRVAGYYPPTYAHFSVGATGGRWIGGIFHNDHHDRYDNHRNVIVVDRRDSYREVRPIYRQPQSSPRPQPPRSFGSSGSRSSARAEAHAGGSQSRSSAGGFGGEGRSRR